MVTRQVDLATMPIYVRAGAILPVDPIRQFTGEKVDAPLTLRIHRGADGDYTLYEDDGESLAYLKGSAVLTRLQWNDKTATLKIQRKKKISSSVPVTRSVRIELMPAGTVRTLDLTDKSMTVRF